MKVIEVDDAIAEPVFPYVSCAPFRLYGIARPPELPVGAAPQDYGIQVIDQLFAASSYSDRFPADGFVVDNPFTDDLRRFYESIETQHCPPSLLVRIKDATLFRSVIYCASESDGAWLYETHRPSDRAVVAMPTRSDLAKIDGRRFSGLRRQNLYIGSVGTPNYGHWLIDDLPRLKAAMHLMTSDPRPIRILLHEYYSPIDKVRADTIRLMFGENVSIEWLDFNRPYRFDELFYATPVSDHPVQKSPLALAFSARKLVELAVPDPKDDGRGDRLFVTRAADRGRSLTNQPEVRELLTARGFRAVDPESLDAIQQIRLFAGAQVVIGQMGAAMTNMMFCPPTAKCLYLAPCGWIEPFYWDLARVRGHRYRVLYGAVSDPGVPPHESAFAVSIEALSIAVGEL